MVPTATPRLLPLPVVTATPRAVPTQTGPAATPVIIASPTATATPVTHVVEEGDTLLSIALEYGVSVEALQAANPNVQPQFLSIGAVLIIPPPEGEAAISATHLAPPPPAPVNLGVPACYTLNTGALACFVEARNPGAQGLENVSARLTLAGSDGLPVASAVAFSALDLIPAGGAAPLALMVQPAPEVPIAAAAAEVLTADLAGEPAPPTRAIVLEIPSQTGTASGTRWTVTGQVRNPSDRAASQAWVVLTLYDGTGAITGYRKVALAGGLGPGEARDFAVSADALAGTANTYYVTAEGRP